ncbi:uncharacterized protein LOC135922209 [Gordionus sp. m RMFG-2023]|uniref:uncharacterized protein LOC135922209 n=1 Tax=Gordionus sp. m RMFG-2023 TaxID=3053472 RepID=UPI0031FC20E8
MQYISLATALVGGCILYFKHNIDSKAQRLFQEQEFYKQSVQIIRQYKPLVNIVGEPITMKKIKIMDFEENYVNSESAKVTIPFKAPKHNGFIRIEAIKSENNLKLKSLNVMLDGHDKTISLLHVP